MRRLCFFSAAVAGACMLGFYVGLLACGILGALSLCALLFLRFRARGRRALFWFASGLLCGCILLALYTALAYLPAQTLAARTLRLEAVVTGFPEETTFGLAVPVRGNEAGKRPVTISLRMSAAYADLQPGDEIACVVRCQKAGAGGNWGNALRARGVFLSGKVYGGLAVTPVERPPLRYAPAYAAKALDDLFHRLYPMQSAGFLSALVTGNTAGLSAEDRNAFATTGLSHVVSVSGMHVSFLAGLLMLLFRRNTRGTAALQIAIIFFFAAMAGNGPGALRAAVFWSVGLLAPFFGRRSDSLTSLSAALLFLLVLRPYAIADVSLQLSFAATVGILLLAQPLQARWLARLSPARRRLLAAPIGLLVVGLCVNVFTIPLSALYFEQVSLISPLTNLAGNWAVALAFLGGVISLALGALFLPLGALVARVVELPVQFFLWLSGAASRLTFAALPLDSVYYRMFLVFAYALLLAALFWWHRGERRLLLPVCAGVMGLCTSLLLTNWSLRGHTLDFALLDVGQGQSVALLSEGRAALIDCGGSRQAGAVAAAYFHGLGYGRLDLLVLTHYDADHIDGVSELFKRMRISAVALPESDADNPLRRELELLALQSGAELWYIEAETQVALGRCALTLYPPQGAESSNEAGLSALCAADDWAALVTGDMGIEGEQRLLAQYALPELSLYVAGHHGSRHSSSEELLDTLSPARVLISVGEHNPYDHPAEETLQRFDERAIPVYRTDRMGSIFVTVGK